ncbi:MAG TPA: hypothetical protein VIC71_13140 [Gammaproteobacteria bacterium]
MIVSTESGGLGNRIKSWVSAMRIGADARVYWPITPNMPARFADLFANDCAVESVPPGAVEHKSWRLAVLPQDEPYLPAGFATVGGGAHPLIRGIGKMWWIATGRKTDRYRYMLFPKQHSRRSTRADARHIDLEYERIPPHFRTLYAELFGRIRARPEIAERAATWARAHFDASIIGVQVRTWRDDPRRYRKYHKPSLQRLLKLLEHAGAERRFFVVSDSDDIVPMLKAALGASRFLEFSRTTERATSWKSAPGMVEDLIDMLLLARARELFASYLSTFSEAAWWLGGARARVAVF